MLITRRTRQTAIVDHEEQYEIDDQYWDELLASGLSQEEALDEARSQAEAESVSYSTEMVGSLEIHETNMS